MTDQTSQTAQPVLAQGDPRLLLEPGAQRLLGSSTLARMSYVGRDGGPRIVPTWFLWTGGRLVMVTFVAGPQAGIAHPARRIADLRADPRVAVSIDTDGAPPTALQLRGRVEIDEVDGIAPEYATSARRYLGAAGAADLLAAVDRPGTRQARITLRPDWVGLIDFATRLPSAQGGPRSARGSRG
ncbi:pyridoxamine 5'-phosphate oxidase family protein [Cellulomonas humilata]|uniref:Pyridoxamine 5'-phosphate oxidase N-terminal domain-containing protein n=1 Tax=Cellulomonas humilata TaxID=144055 RepID=A0ABU0EBK4_9CELL|nr:pyridoxamine 5'-phosphate oxidase family protein [Cellulomonas humilata]MDQ0372648.1 hypothetical protein [Cellulomonas humilata]